MVVASANQQPGADELDDVGRSLALSLLGEADGSGLRARRRAARAAQREAVSAPAEPDVAPTDAAPVRRRRVVTTGATPPTAPTPSPAPPTAPVSTPTPTPTATQGPGVTDRPADASPPPPSPPPVAASAAAAAVMPAVAPVRPHPEPRRRLPSLAAARGPNPNALDGLPWVEDPAGVAPRAGRPQVRPTEVQAESPRPNVERPDPAELHSGRPGIPSNPQRVDDAPGAAAPDAAMVIDAAVVAPHPGGGPTARRRPRLPARRRAAAPHVEAAPPSGRFAESGAATVAEPRARRPREPIDVGRVAEPSVEASADEDDDDGKRRSFLLELGLVFLCAMVVALLIRAFALQTFSIPSESMVPTLQVGDRVLVNKLAYTMGGGIERGDVIVFARPKNDVSEDPNAPDDLIKRVIALPGEVVEARGGIVYVDGKPLDEQGDDGYLPSDIVTNNVPMPVTVPPGQVFVMGDNRERSRDSRFFGAIAEDSVVGRAVAVVYPFSRAGSL